MIPNEGLFDFYTNQYKRGFLVLLHLKSTLDRNIGKGNIHSKTIVDVIKYQNVVLDMNVPTEISDTAVAMYMKHLRDNDPLMSEISVVRKTQAVINISRDIFRSLVVVPHEAMIDYKRNFLCYSARQVDRLLMYDPPVQDVTMFAYRSVLGVDVKQRTAHRQMNKYVWDFDICLN